MTLIEPVSIPVVEVGFRNIELLPNFLDNLWRDLSYFLHLRSVKFSVPNEQTSASALVTYRSGSGKELGGVLLRFVSFRSLGGRHGRTNNCGNYN